MNPITRRDCVRYAGAGAACALLPLPAGLGQSGPGAQVLVRAGAFPMGTSPEEADALAQAHGYHPTWLEGELPRRLVWLPTFAIDRYPVTNQRYFVFCTSTGHRRPPHWEGGQPPVETLDHPVVNVSHDDAQAYAAWAGMRLPTEAEWEKTARGPLGRTFPWGDVFDPTACRWNSDPGSPGFGTAPVTAHPAGVGPYGAYDLVGNVAEWCADRPSPVTAIVKGGSWHTGEILDLRAAGRNLSCWASNLADGIGFRCAKDVM